MKEIPMEYNLMNKFKEVSENYYCDKYSFTTINEMAVYITNACLACEIGLKGILYMQDNKNHTGHSLLKLFTQLNPNEKNFIYNYFHDVHKVETMEYIESDLKLISNNFIEWRYYFETTDKNGNLKEIKSNPRFIKAFLDVISILYDNLLNK